MNQQTRFKQTQIGRIPDDWSISTLDELSIRITDGSHFSPKGATYGDKNIATVKDMENNSFNFKDCKRISDEDFEALVQNGCSPKKGDILISKDGAKCLDIIFVYNQNKEVVLLSSIAIVRLKKDFNPMFYRYYLLSPVAQKIMREGYVSGSAIPRVILKDFKKIPVPVPPTKGYQDEIAKVLNTFDSKIELLQKQNKTLEAIAQVLFKHWFVDFEFPNEEGKPYKSSGGEMVFNEELGKEIPKGWEVGKLGEFINITSGKRPEQKSEVTDSVFNVPLVGASRVMGFVMVPLFKEPVLIIGRVGTHGVVQRFTTPTYPSDNTLVIRSPFYEYVYQVLKRIDYASLNVGSTQPLITQSSIKNYSIIISEKNIRINFENTVSVLFAKRNANNLEIENLSQIRDTLLPKLMSGEVRINK